MADAPKTKQDIAPKAEKERVYVIPLTKAWKSPYKRRTKKSISVVREFIMRHMKVEKVKLGLPLNLAIWERGIKNPPRKVKVKTAVVNGVGYVDLPDAVFEFMKVKEEKKVAPKKEAAPAKTDAKQGAAEAPKTEEKVEQSAEKKEAPEAKEASPEKKKTALKKAGNKE